MKSENIKRAYQLYSEFALALRMAHTDAIDTEEAYAELLLYQMLAEVSQKQWLLRRMTEAAK